MRKAVPVLVLMVAVVAAGLVLAAAGISPVVGAVLGIFVAGGIFAAIRVPTDRLLWVTTSLFVLTVTWNGIRLAGGAFGNVFLGLAIASLVGHLVVSRQAPPLPAWLLVVGLGMLFAQVLSLIVPPSGSITSRASIELRTLYPTPPYLPQRSDIAYLLKFEIALVVVPVLMMTVGSTRARCMRLLDLFAMSAIASAFVGICAYGGLSIGPTPFVDSRSAGLTIHPNYLAVGCSMAIPLTMLWLTRSDIRWRLAGAGGLMVLLAGVLASGSRAGTATAAAGLVLATAMMPRLRRGLYVILPVAGMVAVLVLVYAGMGETILQQLRLSKSSDVSGSNYARKYAADLALDQIHARPLSGVGFSVIADAHDIYLELLAAGGAIALASFFVFCGGLVGATRRGLRGPQRPEVVAASLAVTLWLIGGILGNELADKFLYVVPGILMALARTGGRRSAPSGNAGRGRLPAEGPSDAVASLQQHERIPISA